MKDGKEWRAGGGGREEGWRVARGIGNMFKNATQEGERKKGGPGKGR